jgi:hypothetical protein
VLTWALDYYSLASLIRTLHILDLPVCIGKYTLDGGTYRMIIAGPFGSKINGILSKLRSYVYAALH